MTDIALATLRLAKGASLELDIPARRNILFYVIEGKVAVNGREAQKHQLVEFGNQGEQLKIASPEGEAIVLMGHAEPLNEPVVAQGPFVMNTQQEIVQAYDDFRSGRMGVWKG